MTLGEIEPILGLRLPDAAGLHRPWWANSNKGSGAATRLPGGRRDGRRERRITTRRHWCSSARHILTDIDFRPYRDPIELVDLGGSSVNISAGASERALASQERVEEAGAYEGVLDGRTLILG